MKLLNLTFIALILSVFTTAIAQNEARVVNLEGQANFRDIGGYKTKDGRVLKMGKVYRSGELPKLTDKDIETLESLNVNTLVNFLMKEEIEKRGRDRLPEGVREIFVPIDSDVAAELTKEVNLARDTGDFSKIPVELNPEVHRLLTEVGAESYAALIREIIKDKDGALIYHCSHGVHRTGTATAIILSLVGVPWESVRQDYLLSNETRRQEVKKRIVQLGKMTAKTQGIPFEQVDMTNIKAFYILEGEYIDATRDEIIKNYGSFENYAKKGLGLSGEEIKTLKNTLLN
ncbi:MAG: tyrosine-protein phosphatase [Anaerolineae bacterium]|nr:tyrosine-protein phosphatase [Anaerolineae bacterium]